MTVIKPFAALRPDPARAAHICELPYDVMSSDEARALAAGNPLSFLHVSKPEIDLPPGTDVHAPEVYDRGGENFERLLAEEALLPDSEQAFYLYRQVMGAHRQTGLVAVASCQAYLDGVIKKHELTRPDKEDDRVRHIETLNAQTGPVFLTYRAAPAIDAFVARVTQAPPAVDFVAPDGVRHTAWVVNDATAIGFLAREFAHVPAFYIADGHHRCAAAARVYRSRGGAGNSSHFLAVVFPHTEMQILAYHRVVKDLNGLSPGQFLRKLDAAFVIQEPGASQPPHKHSVSLHLDGRWFTLLFRPTCTVARTPVERLDVTLLQRFVLAPLLGIDDPRTSQRLQFVGGIRGPGELERLVNSGEFACAFSMFPTDIEDLMTIADEGGIMPPKSTWFEPKLRDAMFCHQLD